MPARFVENLEGRMRIRILDPCVSAGRPRVVGEIIEVDALEGYELICMQRAEPYIESPELRSLE